MAAVNFPVY